MHVSRRRPATLRLLIAAAFGALVLTGCSGQTEDSASPSPGTDGTTAAAPAGETPADGATATASPAEETGGTGSAETPPAEKSPFAGTKQFVTIDKAWTEDGVTRLSVRPAEKKVNTQFDTWEITPGTGDFTTVPLAKDARVLLTVPVREQTPEDGRAEPVATSQAAFVTQFMQLDPRIRAGVGFDLSFDGQGRVTKVQSLFRP